MPTSNFTFYDVFFDDIHEGVHTLGSDTIKVALTNAAPNTGSHAGLSDITEISGGNGYTAGGATLANVSSTQTSGTYTFDADDLTFTASGGSIGPFRYAVVYNDTSTGDRLIGYLDYGSAVTLADTETLDVTFNASGIFTAS